MLSGPFPSSLGRLVKLYRLFLGYNNFDPYELPAAISSLPLRDVDLQSTNLRGSLRNLEGLSQLRKLQVGYNQINSTLPDWLGRRNFTGFAIPSAGLFGSIPAELLRQPSLQSLDLSGNRLVGTLPDFPRKSELLTFDVSRNQVRNQSFC